MALKSRLKKIEEKVNIQEKLNFPTIIGICVDDDQNKVLQELKNKYGEDYKPKIVIIHYITRKEARKQGKNFPYII